MLVHRSSTGLAEMETPFLEGAHRFFMCTGSQGKAGSLWESGLDMAAVLGGPPGKAGVNVTCCEGRTLEAKLLGIFISGLFSGGGHFGNIWFYPSVWRSPRANNNPGGITAPLLSKQAA